jgi:spermidine synthase
MSARRLVLLAYTCSGFAGLVYQVTWTRLLVLHVGSTTAAITTVVAAFMGGLAIGAAVAGTIAPGMQPRRALSTYAALEIGAAAAALLLPAALAAFRPVLAWAYGDDGTALLFSVTRTTACLAAVTVPAVLLGATFPMAIRGLARSSGEQIGGTLYALNTAGAACGSLAAGFTLLPSLGLRLTTLVGAAGSVLAALIALAAGKLLPADGADAPLAAAESPSPPPRPARRSQRGRNRGVEEAAIEAAMSVDGLDMSGAVLIVAVTGFAGLLYEVAWTRASASLLGPTTYAFAAVVSTLIAGMALGSAIGVSRWMRRRRPQLALAVTLGVTGVVVWWGNVAIGTRVPESLARAFATAGGTLAWPLLVQMASAIAPLAPAAIGLGISFPLALRLSGPVSAPKRIGWLYAINTAAGVAGTFLAAPLLVRVGLEGALRIVPTLLLAAAAVSLLLAFRFRALIPTLASAALLALAVSVATAAPAWDRELLASGIYKYARTIPQDVDLESVLKAATLLDYRDGEHASVAVTEFAGTRSLVVDGKVDGSTGGDMLTQELVAHLPLLMHERPRDVLVIGLGTGVTLASAVTHPAERIDVVEISPEIVAASSYFREQNRNALSDPRVHLIVGDGRSQLRLGHRLYDVIISEPSNPWVAGMAALFTRETFASIKARLAPGGTACQWVHTYDISEADLRSIVATFVSVFPDSTLWMVGDGDLLLAASNGPIEPKLANIPAAWQRPGVAADLQRVGVADPFGVLSMWAGNAAALAQLAGGAPIQTDDRMALEFSGPTAVYRTEGANQVKLVRAIRDAAAVPDVVARARESAGAAAWRARAAMLQNIHVFDEAYRTYVRAFELDPGDEATVTGLAAVSLQAGTAADAIERLDKRRKTAPGSTAVRVALSKLLASTGRRDAAVDAVTPADSTDPSAWPLLTQLAALYADAGDLANLERTVQALQALRPNDARTRYFAASARFMQGAHADALTQLRMSLAAAPGDVDALTLQGDALASLGRFDEAQRAFDAALQRAPADPTIFVNLGQLALARGDLDQARKLFVTALTLSPSFRPAHDGLARTAALRERRG